MAFPQPGQSLLSAAGYTDTALTALLVNNPTAQTFPLSINGQAIGGNPASIPQDVSRQQILDELSRRIAAHTLNGKQYSNQFYTAASPVGAVALAAVPPGDPNVVTPATPGVGPVIPVQVLGQIK